MGILVFSNGRKPSKSDLVIAQEEHGSYIKITMDLKLKTVAIGGQYHVDAEQILINEHGSKSENIVGGGYDTEKKEFSMTAMINLRPIANNPSMEILDVEKRSQFLEMAKNLFK